MEEQLADLKQRVVAAENVVAALQADLKLIKAGLDAKAIEIERMQEVVKQVHHDHQGVRNLVGLLLTELEALVPIP